MLHLFPYMGAGNQYELIDFNLSWKQGLWPDEATGTIIPILFCPSDNFGVKIVPRGGIRQCCPGEPDMIKSNYLAFFNGYQWSDTWGNDDPLIQAAFGLNRGARIAHITDGTSNTMLFAEYLTGTPTDDRAIFYTFQAGYSFLSTRVTPNNTDPDRLIPGVCFSGYQPARNEPPVCHTSHRVWIRPPHGLCDVLSPIRTHLSEVTPRGIPLLTSVSLG